MAYTMRFNVIIREMKFLNYNELLMVAARVGSWTHSSSGNVNDLVIDMSFGLSLTKKTSYILRGGSGKEFKALIGSTLCGASVTNKCYSISCFKFLFEGNLQ